MKDVDMKIANQIQKDVLEFSNQDRDIRLVSEKYVKMGYDFYQVTETVEEAENEIKKTFNN